MHPEVELDDLERGQEVALNESLNVVLARGAEISGEVVVIKELLEDGDARADRRSRRRGAGRASSPSALIGVKLRAGDHLLMDTRSGLLTERLPRPEVEELVLEEVPDVTYDDVGGLDDQIEQIKDAVELPYLLRRAVPRARAAAAEGHPALRPARLRQDAHREGGRQLARQAGRREDRQRRGRARTSSTSRAPSCSTSTSARPSARSA